MKATLSIMHHHDNDWKRELEFYVDELAILTGRLAQINSKTAGKVTLAKATHFKNEFVALREEIDTIGDNIKTREKKIEKKAMDKPDHIDDRIKVANDKIFDQIMDLSKRLATTRYRFNKFLIKVMYP